MEDAAVVSRCAAGEVVAVFDGHNGAAAARFCMEEIPARVAGITADNAQNEAVAVFTQLHADIAKTTPSGTTASVCLIGEEHVVVALCGDSPVFLLRGAAVERVGADHSLANPAEYDAVVRNGGNVVTVNEVPRVNGEIVLTRSLGDTALHPPLIATPDVFVFPKDMDAIVLVTDGITDVL